MGSGTARSRGALSLAAMFVLALPGAGVHAVILEISTYWGVEGESELAFSAGGRELCRFGGQAPAGGYPVRDTCRFELPPGTSSLEIRGRYVRGLWNPRTERASSQTIEGETRVRLYDASAVTTPLRDASLSAGERWRRALAAETAFTAELGGEPELRLGEPQPASAVDAAEARLGYALPAGYRELVTAVGEVRLGRNYTAQPTELRDARTEILQGWGYGQADVPLQMTGGMLDRLARGTLLFLEVGDGMGAELYLPPPNPGCGDGPAFFYLHEESLAEDLEALERDELRCVSFEEMLVEAFDRNVLLLHSNNLDYDGDVLVDFGAPVQALELDFSANERGRFEVGLRRRE